MNITEFIARVRAAGQISDFDTDYTSAEILTEASNALADHYPTRMVTLRSGYWLHRSTVATVANQRRYAMPDRAIANGLEKVEYADDGVNFSLLSILTDYQASDYGGLAPGAPYNYSFEADTVCLYPAPTSSQGRVRFSWYLRPPTLVPEFAGGTIASCTPAPGGTAVLTFSDGTPSWIGGATGFMDIVHATGSGEAALLNVAFSASGFLLHGGLDFSLVRAGDVIQSPGTSDVIPLPKELHRSLADYTAAAILSAKGDFEKMQVLAAKAENAIKQFVDVANPRTKANPYLFRTKNTYLRRRLGAGRWYG